MERTEPYSAWRYTMGDKRQQPVGRVNPELLNLPFSLSSLTLSGLENKVYQWEICGDGSQ